MLCAPDLAILKSIVLRDIKLNMGAIIARQLHHNSICG
jgi:hypothetical protein